jgi:hypothetical protein
MFEVQHDDSIMFITNTTLTSIHRPPLARYGTRNALATNISDVVGSAVHLLDYEGYNLAHGF